MFQCPARGTAALTAAAAAIVLLASCGTPAPQAAAAA
ncbi:MAG: hypothetical protein JWQ76_655, partial [Ramlibacter sp.]|nr:hypothetical protein [Ramlibacter sp.]